MSEFYIAPDGTLYGGDRQIRGINPETDEPIYDDVAPQKPDSDLYAWDSQTRSWVEKTAEYFLGPKESIKQYFRTMLLQMAQAGMLTEQLSGLIATLRAGIDLTLTDVENGDLPWEVALPMVRGSINSAALPSELEAARTQLLQYVESVLNPQ